MRNLLLFVFLLVAYTTVSPLLRGEETDIVTDIRIKTSVKFDKEELFSLIEVQSGERLDYLALDNSIRAIYGKGKFKSISVWKEKTEEGIVITFVLLPRDTTSKIEFNGNRFITSKRLRRNIPIKENDNFSQELVNASIETIIALYKDKGFFNARVLPVVSDLGNSQFVVRFEVQEGSRASISEIRLNIRGKAPQEVLQKMLPSAGDYYEGEKINRGVENIHEYLREKGYWSSSVSRPQLVFNSAQNTVHVMIDVESGPEYGIEFRGNRVIKDEELLEIAVFKAEETFSPEKIDRWAEEIKKLYQTNGYAQVEVRYEIDDTVEDKLGIIFNIRESKPMRISRINFYGNEFLSDKNLKSAMLTKERGILSGSLDFIYDWLFDYYPKGILLDDRLKEDIDTLEYLYKREGFLSARVVLKSIDYHPDDGDLIINISVAEGERTIVKEVIFEGNESFPDEELYKVIHIKDGSGFDPWKIDDSIKSLKEFYNGRGYLFVELHNQNEFSKGRKEAVVKFLLREGPQAVVRKVYLSGNTDTRGYVIRRELLFKEGDTLSFRDILLSQQKIYKLGFIDRATVDIKEAYPDGSIDIGVKVKEKKPWRVDMRFGYGSAEGLRSSVEVVQRNLGGRGQSLSLRGDASYWVRDINPLTDLFKSDDNYFNTGILNLGFRWPWLFRQNIDFRINYIYQFRKRIYELESNDIIVGVERDLTRHYHGGVQYQIRFRHPLSDNPDLRYEEKRRLGFMSFFLFHDTRNNPFEPRKGHLQTYRVDYASRYLVPGGEYDYLKFFLKGDFYYAPLRKLITAFSIRSGYGYVIGGGDIPIEERFFLGGTTSVRGYEEDSLGPYILNQKDGSIIPGGGDFMLGYNVELRFPLGKGFGLVLFTDGGNVWEKANSTSFDGIITLRDMRESAGAGLRYMTPIGPLRLDLGLKLDKQRDEPLNEWHFFVGNMF